MGRGLQFTIICSWVQGTASPGPFPKQLLTIINPQAYPFLETCSSNSHHLTAHGKQEICPPSHDAALSMGQGDETAVNAVTLLIPHLEARATEPCGQLALFGASRTFNGQLPL